MGWPQALQFCVCVEFESQNTDFLKAGTPRHWTDPPPHPCSLVPTSVPGTEEALMDGVGECWLGSDHHNPHERLLDFLLY